VIYDGVNGHLDPVPANRIRTETCSSLHHWSLFWQAAMDLSTSLIAVRWPELGAR
jgi:hypothetical protein